MTGAIIGDIVGSRFEYHNIHTKKFCLLAQLAILRMTAFLLWRWRRRLLQASRTFLIWRTRRFLACVNLEGENLRLTARCFITGFIPKSLSLKKVLETEPECG